jgi:hypothetical protein
MISIKNTISIVALTLYFSLIQTLIYICLIYVVETMDKQFLTYSVVWNSPMNSVLVLLQRIILFLIVKKAKK